MKRDRTITAITNKVPLLDNNNKAIGILGITTDITDQKNIEEALRIAKNEAEIANQTKTELIANMSHDIRTPLSSVMVIAKALEDSIHDERIKRYGYIMRKSGQQLFSLLDGVIDVLSAEQMNEANLDLSSFDLRKSIQNLQLILLPLVKTKNIDFQVHIDPAAPSHIVSDRLIIERILLNLIGNAIKFTEKGHVRLDVKELTSNHSTISLKFCVSDTGIGISKVRIITHREHTLLSIVNGNYYAA